VHYLSPPALTTIRQTILQNITGIREAVVVDIMDMEKAECSINRILPVRDPRCRENKKYVFE